MASLNSLQSDLNYWNGQVNALNDKIKKLQKRRRDVDGVKSALKTVVNNNTSDVNDKVRVVRGKLDSAINYTGKDSLLNDILSGKDERALGGDSNLTNADGELQSELNSIDRQISEAENSLATAKRRVSDIKTAIAAEERRLREEAARKAAEARADAIKK